MMDNRFSSRGRNRRFCYRYLDDVTLEDLSYYNADFGRRPLRLRDGSCRFFERDFGGLGRNYYRRRDILEQVEQAIKARDEKKEEGK